MIRDSSSRQYSPSHQASVAAFAEAIFGHLPRQDQRRWAETYLRGLLGTPGRKSVRRMAEAVADTPTASQSLHQFVSASPWPWDPSRRALADWIEERAPVRAWTLAPVVAPKRGEHSVGVHRRFDAVAGRVINCQVGVGMLMSTCCGSIPVDWRLHLPETWCQDEQLRRRAKIPASGDPRPLWALGLEQVDAMTARGEGPTPPVIADGRELADTVALVNGLSSRCHSFLVSARGSLMLHAGPHLGPQRHPRVLSTANRLCMDDHLPQRSVPAQMPAPRDGRTPTGMWTLSGPVHLPRTLHTLRLLAKWHPSRSRPTRIWLTNLMNATPDDLMVLVDAQAGTHTAMRSLSEDFGLLDFEGRSFPGWHHHTTLVSAAYGWHRLAAAPGHAHAPGWDPRAAPAAPLDWLRRISC
ncbi:IS701 family transposase [Streptacidiphilus sp. PAMC 29251]